MAEETKSTKDDNAGVTSCVPTPWPDHEGHAEYRFSLNSKWIWKPEECWNFLAGCYESSGNYSPPTGPRVLSLHDLTVSPPPRWRFIPDGIEAHTEQSQLWKWPLRQLQFDRNSRLIFILRGTFPWRERETAWNSREPRKARRVSGTRGSEFDDNDRQITGGFSWLPEPMENYATPREKEKQRERGHGKMGHRDRQTVRAITKRPRLTTLAHAPVRARTVAFRSFLESRAITRFRSLCSIRENGEVIMEI